ncbi:MAG: ATP-binding protein [Clostridia bacterium]|nr:ATP-binding protein [Clostridia bacterium]
MRELSLNVMDIAQNSIVAGASRVEVLIDESVPDDLLSISINDNGKGMSPEQVESVTNPFFTTRTTRKVGLGVPLFKMEAEMTGGSFYIESELGVGTKLTANFKPSHIDMIPLGDINSTMLPLITQNPEINFVYRRTYKASDAEAKEFSIETNEIKEILGDDIPLDTPEIYLWLKEFFEENTKELYE